MISPMLQKARDFEAHYAPFIPPEHRPAFHLTPTIGWMNDPNGFSIYKGEYHLFYQYYPYATEWNDMHWGHVKTKDFLHWERLPAAMAPDQPYDKNGVFSGSAIELPDGRQLLVYTAVRQIREVDGELHDCQTQCIAIGDGVDYEKWPNNPVLEEKDLPPGGSPIDFRDPKIWREPDGTYRLVAGNRTPDGSGAILLYESKNGTDWSYVGTVDASRNLYGMMWECPDFFPLDGKQVLLVSPQEMSPIGLEFHAGHGNVCIVGHYDKEKNIFVRERIQAIDYGIDFYAAQTLEAADGRRIMIGWMQNWNTLSVKPRNARWFGQMSLPRELTLDKDGRLIQTPVREIELYRRNPVVYQNVLLSGEISLVGVYGRMIDMTVKIRPVSPSSYSCFRLHLARDGQFETTLRYKPDTSILKMDRTRSGSNADTVHTRSILIKPREDGALKLRLIMDRNSIEVFVNDGEVAASVAIFTRQDAVGIGFEATGSVMMDVEKYDIVMD